MNNKDTVEAPARSYKDHLREQITNAEEATGYLSACYAEGPETFALAVKDVWEFARVDPPAAPTGQCYWCKHPDHGDKVCPVPHLAQGAHGLAGSYPCGCSLSTVIDPAPDEADKALARKD